MAQNKKKLVVVTGGAGFVGSHLCERLVKDGHQVISLDNYFTGSRDNHIEGVEYREGHTKDIAKHIPEDPAVVYHLGEYARVEQSVLEPDVVHDLNVLGTQGVINFWCEKNLSGQKCKFVYAGSSTKFGDGGSTRHTSPYARTKADNSERVRDVGEKKGLPYAITYFYNVYGPRERSGVYGTVIEHFKHMYLSGAPCAVVSPGTQTRNFTHVEDIVDGLIRVGDEGHGDEYGLGCEEGHRILDVARMFGFGEKEIVMFPEREGNRMKTALDTTKIHTLGWKTKHSLSKYITDFVSSNKRGNLREKRVLVFSTTMYPVAGDAEKAFVELASKLPDVSFDTVTTRFTRSAHSAQSLAGNIHVYRVGIGAYVDKFLLPKFGALKGVALVRKHRYLFAWGLLASYAALAGIAVRWMSGLPLLITLADQNVSDLPSWKRSALRLVLSRSDQIYGTHSEQERQAQTVAGRMLPRKSLGEGDAFANALRFAYADILRKY